ncbi:MAG TPA: family 20 glycosylhydrolase [Candidatus Angelobacter sp.]
MLPLMPMPAHIESGEEDFAIDPSFAVDLRGHTDPRVRRAADRFLSKLSRRVSMPLGTKPEAKATFIITCNSEGEKIQKLGEDESYRLQVTSTEVRLDAPNPLGVIRGLQTFLQLVRSGPGGASAPAVLIEDSPRFPWRGLLIDVSRHFMPVDVIKRNLDGMETMKFNVLHWHLSDDQGFRVESRKFPKFQQLLSDGLYYTRDQIKDVIAYARDRGIRVMPEFDVPGHTTSWLAAYPELAAGPGPYEISRHFGVHNAAMDPTRDHTYHFLNDFIGEMSRLFPDQYFHIGGDEVNGKQWDANDNIRRFKRKHHLSNNLDLQAYFNKRLQKIVKKHGKVMVGWDEILHADLPKDVVVQSWRGLQSLADAARQGYRGILSFGYYLDLMQPASQHYSIDPLNGAAANLTPEEKQRILGGEACMWAELITADNIDERIWPRAAAIAERLWSPQDVRDVDSMYIRLQAASENLKAAGVLHQTDYRAMLERLAAGTDAQPLRVLAQVLEPVKGYARTHTGTYETSTPLNRLVDAVQPESDAGREFARMTERVLNKSASAEDISAMRRQLSAWQENDQRLEPLLQSNALLQEVVPLSQSLASAATAALRALDYLNAGGAAPAAWRDQQLVLLKDAEKPQAEMLNTIAPCVERLVEATIPDSADK